jgi:hypothetical protein
MARIRRAPRRAGNDKWVGIALGLVGLVLIVVLGVGTWWLRKSKEQLDADNCPRSGVRALHVLMIDRSDPISPQQAQMVRQHVQTLKNEAKFGTRFDIYTFEGDTKNEMQPVVRVCAPGRPEEANEWIENPEQVRRRYEERFLLVLERGLDELLSATSRDNSPVIESLRAASITSFGPLSAGKIPVSLTLVSDMVQHSTMVSHFKAEPNFAQLQKSQTWPTLRPDLKGADVEILYLLRPAAKRGPAPIQNRGHQAFWEQLILAGGGRVKTIRPL